MPIAGKDRAIAMVCSVGTPRMVGMLFTAFASEVHRRKLVERAIREDSMMRVEIAPMTPEDWDEVRAIYMEGIASGQATFEVDAPLWEQWDCEHHAFARLVARSGGRVVGWVALSPVSRRRCYAGVAEVSVYVGADHRGLGIGRQLLMAAITESERHGVWTLQGATFPENTSSLRLQQTCGFREIGRRERIAQFQGVWRDTILMERRSTVIGTDGAEPQRGSG